MEVQARGSRQAGPCPRAPALLALVFLYPHALNAKPNVVRTVNVQMSLKSDGTLRGTSQDTCPPVEITMEPRREQPPEPQCGCSASGRGGGDGILRAFSHSVVIPRTVARLKSCIATAMLLGLMFCLGTFLFAGICSKSRAIKRAMRPVISVAKQWAGDLSDVFVIFPLRGALLLLRLCVVVPLRALHAVGFAIHSARKLRLQRQLLEEADSQEERHRAKQARHERGIGGGVAGVGGGPAAAAAGARAGRRGAGGAGASGAGTRTFEQRKKEPPQPSPPEVSSSSQRTCREAAAGAVGAATPAASAAMAVAAAAAAAATQAAPSAQPRREEQVAARTRPAEEATTAGEPRRAPQQPAGGGRRGLMDRAKPNHENATSEQRSPATAAAASAEWSIPGAPERQPVGCSVSPSVAEPTDDGSLIATPPPAATAASATELPAAALATTSEPRAPAPATTAAPSPTAEAPPVPPAAPSTTARRPARVTAGKAKAKTKPRDSSDVQKLAEGERPRKVAAATEQAATAACAGSAEQRSSVKPRETRLATSSSCNRTGTGTAARAESPRGAGTSVTSSGSTGAMATAATARATPDTGNDKELRPKASKTVVRASAVAPGQMPAMAAPPPPSELPDHEASAPQGPASALGGDVAGIRAGGSSVAPTRAAAPAAALAAPAPTLAAATGPTHREATKKTGEVAVKRTQQSSKARDAGAPPPPPPKAATPATVAPSHVLATEKPRPADEPPTEPPAAAPAASRAVAAPTAVATSGDNAGSGTAQAPEGKTHEQQRKMPPTPPPLTSATVAAAAAFAKEEGGSAGDEEGGKPQLPLPAVDDDKAVAKAANAVNIEPIATSRETEPPMAPAKAEPPATPPLLFEEGSAHDTASISPRSPKLSPRLPGASLVAAGLRWLRSPSPPAGKLPRNLGPPPPGPAPPPPVSAPVAEAVVCRPLSSSDGAAAAPTPPALINDNGWNTGGTGGTADFGWNSEAVIRMMEQQAQLMRAAEREPVQLDEASATAATAAATTAALPVQPQPQPKGAPSQSGTPSKQPVGDEVGQRLERMVEELAGVHSFELLEDAFSRVAAREALSRGVASDSGLRHSAPAFVPGQMWTGQQRSSFVD